MTSPWPPLRLALAALCAGCFTTATVHRRNGPTLHATIDRSDRAALYVTTPEADRYLVERSDVVEIDHPGKEVVAAGLGFFAAGALTWWLTGRAENPSGFIAIPRVFAATGIVVGGPLAIDGVVSYLHSRVKASP
jgi:hypothetical protein